MNLSRLATSLRAPSLRIGNTILSQRSTPSCLHIIPSNHYYFSTAAAVKELRAQTGAPMMECKKALSSPEVDGDLQKAMEWLRKHGTQKASAKVTGREAPEGLVGICLGDNTASLVKVASETDFASRSETFSGFVQEVADAAAVDGDVSDISSFLSGAKNNSGKLLSESLNDVILAIRENIQVDSISVMKASSNSVLGGYVHNRIAGSNCGTAAAIVELQYSKELTNVQEIAKKLAMHVVAAKPAYLNPDSVPEDVVQKEKEILMEKVCANV
jgi:elongation factor Ts